MSDEAVIVRMEHLRELRYCARGVRSFFQRHNLDYTVFLSDGIEAGELLRVTNNDGMAVAAVEVANGRKQ
jgi:hypothetical protein